MKVLLKCWGILKGHYVHWYTGLFGDDFECYFCGKPMPKGRLNPFQKVTDYEREHNLSEALGGKG